MSHVLGCTYSGKPEESRFMSNGIHGDVRFCLLCKYPFSTGDNPAPGLPMHGASSDTEPHRMTDEEVVALLAAERAKRIAKITKKKRNAKS